MTRPPALLALEDGRIFRGEAIGAPVEAAGEVVFNTGMTGYQEVLSDPSYRGQIVTFTYPLLGNHGVNEEDWEGDRLRAQAVVCRDLSEVAGSWRATGTLEDLLVARGVPGIAGVDTRALTRHLRSRGVMRGVVRPATAGSARDLDPDALVRKARGVPPMLGRALVDEVTCAAPYAWIAGAPAPATSLPRTGGPLVAVLDFGVKWGILRRLEAEGFRPLVLPARTPAGAVLALGPEGVVLSNGPGDPEPLDFAIATARTLAHELPLFGICLGHQLLALAFGARTRKLPFGHRGINHPVVDRRTGRIEVTSQNHGFVVETDSLPAGVFDVTHVSANDGTLEGLAHRRLPVLSCQYHPESGPGPHDSRLWFRAFAERVGAGRRGAAAPPPGGASSTVPAPARRAAALAGVRDGAPPPAAGEVR
jgi:carbamoyl-phosphate synthase small subunit